jgi:hypothetical protein
MVASIIMYSLSHIPYKGTTPAEFLQCKLTVSPVSLAAISCFDDLKSNQPGRSAEARAT